MAKRSSLRQLDFGDVKNDGLCPESIGFRLPNAKDREILTARAKLLNVSVHEVARAYTQQALHDRDERIAIRDALQKLQRDVAELRKDIMISTAVLLSSAGKVGPDEAQEWVNKNLANT